MLYLVATPIGNLEDLSFRAARVLSEVDLILCEDKRRTSILLSHYKIQTPLLSFHTFSEAKREEEVIARLSRGEEIALLSDAGTPLISDPGHRLVARCQKEGLKITSLPGPCALITALSLTSLPTDRFEFVGFLPRKEGEQRRLFADLLQRPSTIVCYEAPSRLASTLDLLSQMAPGRKVAVARELTKLYEEVREATAEEMAAQIRKEPVRGEIVLLIAPGSPSFEGRSPKEQVAEMMEEYGLSRQEAIKLTAQLRSIPKSALYKEVHR